MRLLQDREWFRMACIFAGLMCLLALLPLPMFSFLTVVRYLVCATGLWAAFVAYHQKEPISVAVFIAIALLFNPFRQILLPLELWRGAFVVAAILFFLASRRLDPALIVFTSPPDTTEADSGQ